MTEESDIRFHALQTLKTYHDMTTLVNLLEASKPTVFVL